LEFGIFSKKKPGPQHESPGTLILVQKLNGNWLNLTNQQFNHLTDFYGASVEEKNTSPRIN
jgi:hypothetical protein